MSLKNVRLIKLKVIKFKNDSDNQVLQEVNLWLKLYFYYNQFKTYIIDIFNYNIILSLIWLQQVNSYIN